jgi:NAD(P)H-hydrate repair Nnr-like enzyme with NAD(P)H-hydrate epimerase domain
MGQEFSGLPLESCASSRAKLSAEWGISETQVVESASFSLAMVIRVALGLSASAGQVAAIVTDCLSGRIVLSALRQLSNAGATVIPIFIDNPSEFSEEMLGALTPLRIAGADELYWETRTEDAEFKELFKNCHNVILGTMSPGAPLHQSLPIISEMLNEMQTPVHCLEFPPGIDPDTGDKVISPLFASSTLCLGLPLQGLEAAAEYAGRIYTCDISLPLSFYKDYLGDGQPLFCEQPVIQVLPGNAPPPKTESQ